jgi:hypothetical protein
MPRKPRGPARSPKEKIEDVFLDLTLEDQATILEWLRKDHSVCKRERAKQEIKLPLLEGE